MRCLILFIHLTAIISQVTSKRMEDKDIKYMVKFGYMNPKPDGKEHTDEEMKQGLMRFQNFNGMDVTGEMSSGMHDMMDKPRCGMKDMDLDMPSSTYNRAKRFSTVGTRWYTTSLTYRYENYSPDLGEADTRRSVENAFKVWSDVTPLTFREVQSRDADIIILFKAGEHGDGIESAFDGPNGVLAHAYFPGAGIGGDAHFDEAERFGIDGAIRNSIDLFQVGAHEFGHSLGLGHSSDPNALMAPYYGGYIPNFQLPRDDINGIQSLYGESEAKPDDPQDPGTGVVTEPPSIPDLCRTNIDATVYDYAGGVYIFQGSEVSRVEMKGTPMQGYPKQISDVFSGLFDNIDAAYYRLLYKTFVFFKNDLLWEFDENMNIKNGYPKQISELNLPRDLDAVIPWGPYYTYFFKGDQYWAFSETQRRVLYRSGIPDWQGLPNNLDAGFRWSDGNVYFIKNGDYYLHYFYDSSNYGVDLDQYPRSFGEEWFNCQQNSYIYNPSSAASKHVYSLPFFFLTFTLTFFSSIR